MDDDNFWSLLGGLDWSRSGDDDAVIEPVVRSLVARSADDIAAFDIVLGDKLFALDTRAHAEAFSAANGFDREALPADDFLYARCAIVANGPGVYDVVLANPGQFPPDVEFEPLVSLAAIAYARKTGGSAELPAGARERFETYSNEAGWA